MQHPTYGTAYCESRDTYLIYPLVANGPLIMTILAIFAICDYLCLKAVTDFF